VEFLPVSAASLPRAPSGSGLGLAISRRVIESWGGTIEIDSHEGQGTLVRIDLLAPA
jgi:signal transduction histidine kinase